MPRIDPSQLLRTLSVLLAKDGGIRSVEEVPRIVQLMQKFSKKLVSKCIYIHILCSSSEDLLESFLSQKGWDLLNMWFSDAIKNQNYYLCGDLVKLFAVCPMNSARLKENVEINQAPKLIRQLSCDLRIEQSTRNLALQVLQQWMSVIRAPQNLQISNNPNSTSAANGNHEKPDHSEPIQKEASNETPIKNREKYTPKKLSPTKEKKRHNVIESSDSEDIDNEFSLSERHQELLSKISNKNKIVDSLSKTNTSKDDSTDVDDLLGGDTTSEDENSDRAKKVVKKLDENSKTEADFKKRKEERDKDKEKRSREKDNEREERKRKEREREKRKMQERRDKAKPYSRSELRTSLDSTDKERIKEVAKKLKEESGNINSPSSIGRIPKISKPISESDDKKKNGTSFGDMLGELDTKKSKPKAPPIKNKNKDLLESISNPSPLKSKSKLDNKSSEDKSKREKERRNSVGKLGEDKKSRGEKIDSKETNDKKVLDTEKEKSKPKILIPDKTGEKRTFSDANSKVESKKSPSIIKESSLFGDVLGDIMKEPPRKKKRRPSDVKVEKDNKESSDLKQVGTTVDADSPSQVENAGKDENLIELEENKSDSPREVRGILVYAKGQKSKRKVQWRDHNLVEIEYFELDETERANVWKIKSFEEMKKNEAMLEKMKLQSGTGEKIEEPEDVSKSWTLVALEFDQEGMETVTKIWEGLGSKSEEKSIQEQRELRVLKSLYFNQIPSDPTEPDSNSNEKSGIEPKIISPYDLGENRDDSLFDYSKKEWPVPTIQSQQNTPPISTSSISALLKDIDPSLLVTLPPPPLPTPESNSNFNHSDAKQFSLQKATAEALASNSFPMSQQHIQGGSGHGQHNGYSGYQQKFHNSGNHRGHNNHEKGFKSGSSNYYHNSHYNKNYKGRDGRDNREDHRDRGYRDKNRHQDYKRPCKYWMDRGKCKEEDRCMYPHPSR